MLFWYMNLWLIHSVFRSHREATLPGCWILSIRFHCQMNTENGYWGWLHGLLFFCLRRASSRLMYACVCVCVCVCLTSEVYILLKEFYLSLCRISVGEIVTRNQQMSGKENSLTEIWLMIQKVRFDLELNSPSLPVLPTLIKKRSIQSYIKNNKLSNDCI